jgi:hypothetical protein
VEQDDALLGAVAERRGLQRRDEAHERDVEAEDRVLAAVDRVLEERCGGRGFFLLSTYSSSP